MEAVYNITIVESVDGPSGNVLSEVELADSAGDQHDIWQTDMMVYQHRLGAGEAYWYVRHGNKEIELCDDTSVSVLATLTYSKWPLKKYDTGDVLL